jgi:hypothetical protein
MLTTLVQEGNAVKIEGSFLLAEFSNRNNNKLKSLRAEQIRFKIPMELK